MLTYEYDHGENPSKVILVWMFTYTRHEYGYDVHQIYPKIYCYRIRIRIIMRIQFKPNDITKANVCVRGF